MKPAKVGKGPPLRCWRRAKNCSKRKARAGRCWRRSMNPGAARARWWCPRSPAKAKSSTRSCTGTAPAGRASRSRSRGRAPAPCACSRSAQAPRRTRGSWGSCASGAGYPTGAVALFRRVEAGGSWEWKPVALESRRRRRRSASPVRAARGRRTRRRSGFPVQDSRRAWKEQVLTVTDEGVWIDGARGDLAGLDASTTFSSGPKAVPAAACRRAGAWRRRRRRARARTRCPSRCRERRCAASHGPAADRTGGA